MPKVSEEYEASGFIIDGLREKNKEYLSLLKETTEVLKNYVSASNSVRNICYVSDVDFQLSKSKIEIEVLLHKLNFCLAP